MQIRRTLKINSPTTIRFLTENAAEQIPDFTAEIDQTSIRYEGKQTIIYCGIGKADHCTTATLRSAAARAAQSVQKLKRTSVACIVPSLSIDPVETVRAIIEGICLGAYKFVKYKSEKPVPIATLDLVGATASPGLIRTSRQICEAVNYARDLVNENAGIITPAYLAKEARRLGKNGDLTVTVLDVKSLQRKGLNLITAVGAGSPTPPALILLEYEGAARGRTKTAIIGKGVTFDSGGQNLKPTGSIETMRQDMAGAAAVLAVFSAIVKIKPKLNLIGVIPAVHNAIGSKAFFPGDIYTSYAGKTVEVWSTDAEGRLILADAIAYCRDRYRPAAIIDLATLTGGIITALGEVTAGLFSTNDELARNLFDAGEKTGERLWRLPLYKEYSDSLKGDLGDLRNLSKFKKGNASSITGAAFIREFAGDTPWAHLDIAGTAYNEGSARGEIPQFATGFGVRLLMSYLGI